MLTKKERREKVLIVREDWILDIALFGFPATDMCQVLNVPGLPDDCEVVRCVHEPLYSRFAVVLSHPTFDVVQPGDHLPEFRSRSIARELRPANEEIRRLQRRVARLEATQ